jgi:hypothetical protein
MTNARISRSFRAGRSRYSSSQSATSFGDGQLKSGLQTTYTTVLRRIRVDDMNTRLFVLLLCCASGLAQPAPFSINTIFPVDGNPPISPFRFPASTLVDSAGNIYISDQSTHQVYRRSPSGTLTVVTGSGSAGFSGDGGPATAAQLDHPTALGLDGGGNLYIVDSSNYRVREVAANGTISTVAANGWFGNTVINGLPATQISLQPQRVSQWMQPATSTSH